MSAQSEEWLSALLDGECPSEALDALLDAMATDPALKARWTRMCLVRQAQSGVAVRRPVDLADRVMVAIEVEVAETAPRVVPIRPQAPARIAAPPVRRRRWRTIGSLTAVASAAAVAVVVFRAPTPASAPSSTLASTLASAQIASLPVPHLQTILVSDPASVGDTAEPRWTEIDPAAARELDGFLMEHSNSRAETGMGGALSYARLAVHTADYRTDEPR